MCGVFCTRCKGTGFLNTHQLPDEVDIYDVESIQQWIDQEQDPHDVQVCDCCGDGDAWHGKPGEHDTVARPVYDCM